MDQIPKTNPKILGASFRDPSGFLFKNQDGLFRQINDLYRQSYDLLMSSGLYTDLIKSGLLIPHEEMKQAPILPEISYKVIQPEQIFFISYPYEWSFSQLKDAALSTLEIQKLALSHGMSLKDSSAYNIQFHLGKPTLIDTLSFEIYQEGHPWVAYRQFCQHFLAPLSLMVYKDVRLSQLLRIYIDGIPLDLASALLPSRTRFNFLLLIHIHLHASSQSRFADKPVDTSRQVSKTGLLGLIDSLETAIKKLKWSPKGTEWSDYYDKHNYSPVGLEEKKRVLSNYLDIIQPKNVWDLGANVGAYSRVASERGIETLAFDFDPGAVEQAYLMCKSERGKNLLPLCLDLTNPSPSIGWQNQERMSLLERGPADTIIALALIHHLAISNNVPLDRLAHFFHQLGRWLIIEFVPKTDSQVQRLLSTRVDIFPTYTRKEFERVFANYFILHQSHEIQDSERILYLMEKHS